MDVQVDKEEQKPLRKIIHIDMDCFYAAIEMRDFPELANRPIAVGGDANQRGVISTCNYAARKFGVHSAMPMSKALKLCRHLIVRPGRMRPLGSSGTANRLKTKNQIKSWRKCNI